MSFVYSLVARQPDIVLCEYSDYTGNFFQIARMVLQKNINQNTKSIIKYDKYKIQYINENDLTYLLLSEEVSDKDAFAFLSEVKREILKAFKYDELHSLNSYKLDKGNEILNQYMTYYNTHPMKTKAGELIEELNFAKNTMIENIEKIIQREEKMQIIATKTETLKDVSFNISTRADNVRKKELGRRNKCIMWIIVAVVALLVVLFLVFW